MRKIAKLIMMALQSSLFIILVLPFLGLIITPLTGFSLITNLLISFFVLIFVALVIAGKRNLLAWFITLMLTGLFLFFFQEKIITFINFIDSALPVSILT